MKGITLSKISGLLLASIGLLIMLGWWLHVDNFITVFSDNLHVVFNSALSFCLAGMALLIPDAYSRLQKNMYVGVGAFIALLAALTLSQTLFSYSVGIDNLFVNAWLIDQNPYSGRMADNHALALIFAGGAFMLFPWMNKKSVAITAQTFIFCVLILGFSALLGYFLGLKSLYSWYQYMNMPLSSTMGNAILGLGLWSLWAKKTNYEYAYTEHQEKRIFLLSITITFCVLLLSGLILLRILQYENIVLDTFIDEHVEPTILIAIIVGLGMLLLQLLPLIRHMIRSEKKLFETNTRLKESENRFRSAFDFAAIGMALISQQGRFIRVNQALCQILGYSEKELLTIDSKHVLHPDDLQANKKNIQDLQDGRIKYHQSVQRFFHKSGEIIWGSLNISIIHSNSDEPLYFIAQLQNITAEKNAEEQLRHLAYHDALTGLYNRNRLEEHMQELLLSSQRHAEGFALIFIDLDRFKNINDTLGHDAGDVMLQIVAQRLKNTVRSTDAIARIGGDEFIIIVNNINKVDKITNIVRKMLNSLLQPVMIKGNEVYITMSIGVSVYPYDGEDIETLIKNADLALYRAKELGRNNYQFCTPEMTAKAQQKMARQNAIVHALAKNEFELYYQPTLDLMTQAISGVEALLRWHNPAYQNVNAEEIIHLAEETGLIVALNEWVLKTACNQVKIWHAQGFNSLSLAINLSSRQFQQINFVENLLQILQQMAFPPALLELEITESLLAQDSEHIFNLLNLLKEKQIQIAIHDFSAGYSSLDFVRNFSINKIKIDRKFVQKITLDAANDSIITAIIAMANKLGIKTIAEGVETREQYEFLLRGKCNEIQGFYLMPPSNAEAITKFLANPLMQSYLSRK